MHQSSRITLTWLTSLLLVGACAKRPDAATTPGTPTPTPLTATASGPHGAAVTAPSSSSNTSSRAATEPTCDDVLAALKNSGTVGLYKVEGPLKDPICAWRFDDLNGPPDLSETVLARVDKPGEGVPRMVVLGQSGRRDPASVRAALLQAWPGVQRCLKDEGVNRVGVRVRMQVAPEGKVDELWTDYRIQLADATKECIKNAITSQHFPRDPNRDPTTLSVLFVARPSGPSAKAR